MIRTCKRTKSLHKYPCMFVFGKYEIYVYELQKRVEKRSFGEFFQLVSQGVQINFILLTTYIHLQYQKVQKQLQNFIEKITSKSLSNRYLGFPLSCWHYTVIISYCLLYRNQVPGDCYFVYQMNKAKHYLYSFSLQ